jgi:hypothetical protein
MCIEVYSTEQPIQIPFEHETIRFLTPQSFRGRYTVLVRNSGYKAIDRLYLIYPRPLFYLKKTPEGAYEVSLKGLTDITHRLPDLGEFFSRPTDQRISAHLPDPNNPVCDLPGLEGYWDPGNVSWLPAAGLTARCLLLLNEHHFTAWTARLQTPIAPGDAHWFCWEITVDGQGDLVEKSIYGPIIFHEIASPIDVRRTLVEALQTDLRDIHLYGPDDLGIEHETAIRRILLAFGLLQERRVDIQYYELNVQPGDPKNQFPINCESHGDIRMRSGSPRVADHMTWDIDCLGEPVYEFKSGSIIEPAHPWKNSGFNIRLILGFGDQKKAGNKKPRRRR